MTRRTLVVLASAVMFTVVVYTVERMLERVTKEATLGG